MVVAQLLLSGAAHLRVQFDIFYVTDLYSIVSNVA